jgi:hypothetical protein
VFQPRLRVFLVESLTEATARYAVRKHTSPRTIFARI